MLVLVTGVLKAQTSLLKPPVLVIRLMLHMCMEVGSDNTDLFDSADVPLLIAKRSEEATTLMLTVSKVSLAKLTG